MRKDYSTPVVISRPVRPITTGRQAAGRDEPEAEKQVDYSHLDIIAETERIIQRRLVRHTRTSGKYHCACPFPDCTSKQDAFTVWDRPVLEERGNGLREVHFWCGRCGRTGSLISLIRQYREATTGEQVSWAKAARELQIDPRTWRALDESDQAHQGTQYRATGSAKSRPLKEQQLRAEQELVTLNALYHRARTWLAAGQIKMKDGRQVVLDHAREYLQARGYTLDQARQLGLAYIPTVQEVPELANLVARAWRGRILFPLTGPAGTSGYAGRTLWHWTPGMTAEQHKQILDTWNAQHPDRRITRHYKTHQPAYYGYEDACRASILVIVEGEFDAASVRLSLAELPDVAVCAFGKHFQARLVPMNILHVTLALDVDQAGKAATKSLVDTLQERGVTVSIATPPSGKDWNDCHLLAGLETIRAEIMRACNTSLLLASVPEQRTVTIHANPPRPTEPSGYENGDVCLLCGKQVEESEGAFFVCEDRASVFYGDMFCAPCWVRQNAPTNCDQDRPFTEANSRCPKHHRPLRYSDDLGEHYCDHVDCWGRYRLMRYGAARSYPALSGIIDPRNYLPDTNKAPLYHTASGLPVYPARPAISIQLIAAGADAWHSYSSERNYQAIDQAIKALARKEH